MKSVDRAAPARSIGGFTVQAGAQRALALCFFVSGATSLVLEVAWSKQLSYMLGNTLHAVSTVVAAFLLGLALGARLAGARLRGVAFPLRTYALLQLAIGTCGGFSIAALRATEPLFSALYATLAGTPGFFLLARFVVVFALLLVPTTLMGMTLPVVAGAWGRGKKSYASESGLVYGLNTLGAVTGTLLAGFALIPRLGLSASAVAVGLTDAVVGAVAWFVHRAASAASAAALSRREQHAPSPRETQVPVPGKGPRFARHDALALLYALSGFAALVLEVVWFRYLAYVFGPTADAFALMLALYLAGIAAGSFFAARRARLSRDPLAMLAALEVAAGVVVLCTTLWLGHLQDWYVAAYWKLPTGGGDLAAALAQGWTAALVVLPATLAFGAIFPFAVRCFADWGGARTPVEEAVGRLYAWNTLGGILGSLAAGFLLLPRLGLWRVVVLAGAIHLLIGIAILCFGPLRIRMRQLILTAIASACAFGGAVLGPRPDPLRLNSGFWFAFLDPHSDLHALRERDAHRGVLFYREGLTASVAVTGNDGGTGQLALWVSGKAEADTDPSSRVHLSFLGHLPVLFAASPRRVAVIGFGAGITTSAVLASTSVESVDVLEIEPAVIEASKYFALNTGDPLADPRTRVVIEDGRTHLQYADRSYDVITADPISPVMAGAASLYTTDFYRLVARRLAPGGVFCQWFETWIPSEETYRAMVATIQSVFPHVVMFLAASNSVVLASNEPIRRPWEELRARFDQPAVREQFARIDIDSPVHLLVYLTAGDAALREFARGAVPNSDDRNWLERRMASDLRRPDKQILDMPLYQRFRVARLRSLSEVVPGLPFGELADFAASQPRLVIWQEFVDWFSSQGDSAALARMRVVRADAAPEKPQFTVEAYGELVEAANAARAAGRAQEEERALREILEHPRLSAYYDASVMLAELLAGRGEFEEALDLVRRMQRDSPALPGAFATEAAILRKMGRAPEAGVVVERGLFFNPQHPGLRAMRQGALH